MAGVTWVWWALLALGALTGALAVRVQVSLIRKARRGQSGTEYMAMALRPLFALYPVLLLAGTFSGFMLAARQTPGPGRTATFTLAFVMAGWSGVMLIGTAAGIGSSIRQQRRVKRVMTQAEVLTLMRAGAIENLDKNADGVYVRYHRDSYYDARGTYLYRPQWADPAGFPAYIDAARQMRIAISDRSDPATRDGLVRWITADEAARLLQAGEIKTYNLGLPNPLAVEVAAGSSTGIKLIDYGLVRHLWVEPEAAPVLTPVARIAQVDGNFPQFCVNGHYERPPAS